jgi:chromosome segregation ATPase
MPLHEARRPSSTGFSPDALSSTADNSVFLAPAPRSSPDSLSIDRDNPCEKLVRLMKKHCEVEFELARLKRDRGHVNEKLKQRQAEYEKSMVKHAEFPSIPEIQAMHRARYAEQVRCLDAEIHKAQEDAGKLAHAVAQTVLSAQNRESEEKGASSAAFSQQEERLKKQEAEIRELKECMNRHRQLEEKKEAEIAELQTKIRRLEERDSLGKNDLEAELCRRDAQLKGEIMMMKRVLSEEWKRELKEQLNLQRLEFEKQRAEQQQLQQTELRSQITKLEEDWRKRIEQLLLAHRGSLDTVSSTDVSSLIQKETSALQSNISDLLSRVDQLSKELAQRTQDSISLRNALDTSTQQVEDQARKINDHEAQLSNIDFDVQNRVAEAISFDLPNLKRKVDGVQSRVNDIPKEIDTKHKALSDQIKQFVARATESLAEMLEETRSTVDNHGMRVTALEEAPTSSGRTVIPQSHEKELDLELINSDVAAIKTDYEQTKAKLNRLAQEHRGLVDQVNQATQFGTVSQIQSLEGQLRNIQHEITVLDSQYKNLTTRHVAEQMIGVLEQLYPEASQIVADMRALKTEADNLGSRVESLESRVEDFKESFDEKLEKVSNGPERLYRDFDDCTNHSVGQKRKRIDSEMNGVERLMANGAG